MSANDSTTRMLFEIFLGGVPNWEIKVHSTMTLETLFLPLLEIR